jgi:ribose 5-phosphate isomerase B
MKRIAVSADEHTHMVEVLVRELKSRGHEVQYVGPGKGEEAQDWPDVTRQAAARVRDGEADEAIVCCWTGTGASIAANKVKGIRAALCGDAETARGARVWNHANVLALSLRATSEAVLKEILDGWLSTAYSEDNWNREQIRKIHQMEESQE